MTAADFRRIALSLDGAEEVAHAGLPAFRVGGARFASLASQSAGYGNRTLTQEQQTAFVEEAPEILLPIPGGFGRMGHTHIRPAAAKEDVSPVPYAPPGNCGSRSTRKGTRRGALRRHPPEQQTRNSGSGDLPADRPNGRQSVLSVEN